MKNKKMSFILIMFISSLILGIEFRKVLFIGSEKDERYLFFQAGPLTVDDQGNIYYGDSNQGSIKKYDRQGKFAGQAGRKGTGPQEFQSLSSIYFVREKLIVFDYERLLLTALDEKLNFVCSFRVPFISGIEMVTNGSYLLANGREGWKNKIVVWKIGADKEQTAFTADFGKYEQYTRSPLFYAMIKYTFALDRETGEFLATLKMPLGEKIELIFFNSQGKMERRVLTDQLVKDYNFDVRFFDPKSFRQANREGEFFTVNSIYFLDKKRIYIDYSHGKNEKYDSRTLIVDRQSGKVLQSFNNPLIPGFSLCLIVGGRAYGYEFDKENELKGIAVYDLKF